MLSITIRHKGHIVYEYTCDSFDDYLKERLPGLFAAHLAKRLEAER